MKTQLLFNTVFFALLAATGSAIAGPVDINRAGAHELATELTGVGESRARAIVAYREAHGAFTSADELTNVKGVGLHVVDLNRENIRLGKIAGSE